MKKDSLRINIFFALISAVSGLVIYRLFILSYVNHTSYKQTAQAQNENITNILARGNIYLENPSDSNQGISNPDLYLAATNKKFPLVDIIPSDIPANSANDSADQLSKILNLDKNSILTAINSKSNTTKILARRITNDQVDAIKNLHTRGINVAYETDRFYLGGLLASNVLGFLGYNSNSRSGQYGIESFYDRELFGKSDSPPLGAVQVTGFFNKIKDFINKKKSVTDNQTAGNTINRPEDIVLTIDKNIQRMIEGKLEEVIKKWNASAGTIIVEDPSTGKILAMADRPTFDPNNYKDSEPSLFLNKSTQAVFEPGSSFKPITMSAGIDLNKIAPQTTFTDTGSVNIAGYTIKNFSDKVFGTVTMSQVLEKSINTGAMFVENTVGDDNFLNYAINFGFGQRTGVDLPGEVSGDIANLYSGRKINYLTAAFGQGIAVTPIQLINAYSAIANGGKLMKPYIVDKIIKEGGAEVITKPEVVGIPISEKTSAKLKAMLVGVVDNGFDKARIKGYDVAGKTGTAQIPDGKGGYEQDVFIHDFLGFAPAYNPKFVVLIKIDRPHGITFAADSLSPTFRDIAAFLINYYKIPPTR